MLSLSCRNPKIKENQRKKLIPDILYTEVPKLDKTLQSQMIPAAKTTDRELSGLQELILDATISLVHMLESARAGTLNIKDTVETAQQALKLVGNASAHTSTERHQRASNKELSTLVESEFIFADAVPFLFGSFFQQIFLDTHMFC